jgi:hypothetical protein
MQKCKRIRIRFCVRFFVPHPTENFVLRLLGRVHVALAFAHSISEKMPATPQTKAPADSCFQMEFIGGLGFAGRTYHLHKASRQTAPIACRPYLNGLEPSTGGKPATAMPQVRNRP